MLYKKNGRILDILSYISESIDNLLEQGVVVTPGTDTEIKTKKQKFKVVEDGQLPPNTDTEFYIELKNAKQYKNDVKVGDEIEIEVVDLEAMTDDGILDFLSSDDISVEELEQIVLSRGTTIRVAGKVLRYGPRQIARIKKVAQAALQMKKYADRYGKKIGHSRCYCAQIFDEYIDEDTGKADREIYKSSITDQPEAIQEELLDTWDYCENKYGKDIIELDNRKETTTGCKFLEDWYEDAESLMDSLINDLQSYYKVKGYNKELSTKKKYDERSSVAEKIVRHNETNIKFTSDVIHTPTGGAPTTIFNDDDIVVFEILKTYGEYGDTVLLRRKSDGKRFILGFDSEVVKKQQSNNAFWIVKSDGSIDNIKTTWDGKIMEYKD